MMKNVEFDRLEQFFGSYFHEDWAYEYESEEAAVKDYSSGVDSDALRQTIQELDELISQDLPEHSISSLLQKDFHCRYNPVLAWGSSVNWLHWVRDTLAKYANEKDAQKNS